MSYGVLSGGDHLDEALHTNALCSQQVLNTKSLCAIIPTMWQSELESDNVSARLTLPAQSAGKACESTASSLRTTRTTSTSSRGLVEKVAILHVHTFVVILIVSTQIKQNMQVSRSSSLQTARRADSEVIHVGCGRTSLAENRHLFSARCGTTKNSLLLEIPWSECQTGYTTTAPVSTAPPSHAGCVTTGHFTSTS